MRLYSSNCRRFFVCFDVNWDPLGQFTSNFAQLLELIVLWSVYFLVKFQYFIPELWERKSLQILYECWRRAYHAVYLLFIDLILLLFLIFSIGARVRKLIVHPKEQSWIISATQGNNEVSMWDVETGARRKALWASPAPPLSQKQVTFDFSC